MLRGGGRTQTVSNSRGGNQRSKYITLAQEAHEILLPQGSAQGRVVNEGNRLLWLYYREIYRDLQKADDAYAEGGSMSNVWMHAMGRCSSAIQNCPYRITNQDMLLALKGFGPSSAKPAEVLWELYPPQPLSPDEVAVLKAVEDDEQTEKDAKREAERKRKAAEKQTKKAKKQVDGSAALMTSFGVGANFAGAFTMADVNKLAGLPQDPIGSSDNDSDEQGGTQKKRGKGSKKAPSANKSKEYVPKIGTANYAFLITLYISQKQGNDHETKASLMQKAEQSGLSNKTLFNVGQPQSMIHSSDRYFDGWSSVNKSLVNRTPPLVMVWSNPKKIRLTPEGTRLAASLYQDAVARGKTTPLPSVDPNLDIQAPIPAPSPSVIPDSQPAGGSSQPSSHDNKNNKQPRLDSRVEPQPGHGNKNHQQPRSNSKVESQPKKRRKSNQDRYIAPEFLDDASESDYAYEGTGMPQLGAWGGDIVDEADLGYTYGSDEEDDIYGYGIRIREHYQPASQPAKRRRHDENIDTINRPMKDMGEQQNKKDDKRSSVSMPDNHVAAVCDIDARVAAYKAAEARAAAAVKQGNNPSSNVKSTLLTPPSSDIAPQQTSTGQKSLHAILANNGSKSQVHKPAAAKACASPDVIVLSDSDDDIPCAKPIMPVARPADSNPLSALLGGGTLSGRPSGNGNGATGPPAEIATSNGPTARCGGVGKPIEGINAGMVLGLPPRGSGASGIPAGPCKLSKISQQRGSGGAGRTASAGTGTVSGQGLGALLGSQLSLGRADSFGLSNGAVASGSARQQACGLDKADSTATGGVAGGGSGTTSTSHQQQPYRWLLPRLSEASQESQALRLPPLPQGRAFSDVYEVVLVLDQREQFSRSHAGQKLDRVAATKLRAEQMRAQGVAVEERTLSIGDVTWVARSRENPRLEYMLDCVMERKSCADLISSIQGDSQRFQRQKWWLKQCGMLQVMYLIEGNPDRVQLSGSENKTVKTVMVGNELDGVRVMRTDNAYETVNLLVRLTQSLTRVFNAYSASSSQTAGQDTQVELFDVWNERVRRMKAGGVRAVRDVWGCMLAAVPGLGPNTVEAITTKYPTPWDLQRAYQQAIQEAKQQGRNPLYAAQDMLSALQLPGGVGRVASRSRDVFNYLFLEGSALALELKAAL